MLETRFQEYVDIKFGVRAAMIAQYFWDTIETERIVGQAHMAENKAWCRISMQLLSGYYPFYSKHMVSDTIHLLIKKNIIKKGVFNQDKFDRTNWYTFTEYGKYLMEKGK